MRNFQNNGSKVDGSSGGVARNTNSSVKPNMFGKIKETAVKDKIVEKVEPVKRNISPPSNTITIPLKDSHNTSTSTANTSTDSTQSDESKGKPKNTTSASTISPTNFTGNLTLPQLSKLIQQQAQT